MATDSPQVEVANPDAPLSDDAIDALADLLLAMVDTEQEADA